MDKDFDNIEMRNRNMEEEEKEKEEGETSFGWDDNPEDHNRSISIINTENPTFTRVDDYPKKDGDTLKKLKKDAGNMKRRITLDKKIYFLKIFKTPLNLTKEPDDRKLFDKAEFLFDRKNENYSIIFDNKKIDDVDRKSLEPELFKKKNNVDEFKDLLEKAKKRYEKTPGAAIEEKIGMVIDNRDEVINSIANDSISKDEHYLLIIQKI